MFVIWIVPFDYANMRDPDDDSDKRIDLASELKSVLEAAKRDYLHVVAFTHCDDDHIHGSSEFFYLEHADKYQSEDRIKINELWVTSAMILEEGVDDEARILRAEARYRLIQGKGIRVFSRPEALADWLAENGVTLDSRRHLITNAGELVSTITKDADGIEFFVHSPFSKPCDEGDIDRNTASLVVQATFDTDTKLLLAADTVHEVWQDIVNITKAHKNETRLVLSTQIGLRTDSDQTRFAATSNPAEHWSIAKIVAEGLLQLNKAEYWIAHLLLENFGKPVTPDEVIAFVNGKNVTRKFRGKIEPVKLNSLTLGKYKARVKKKFDDNPLAGIVIDATSYLASQREP